MGGLFILPLFGLVIDFSGYCLIDHNPFIIHPNKPNNKKPCRESNEANFLIDGMSKHSFRAVSFWNKIRVEPCPEQNAFIRTKKDITKAARSGLNIQSLHGSAKKKPLYWVFPWDWQRDRKSHAHQTKKVNFFETQGIRRYQDHDFSQLKAHFDAVSKEAQSLSILLPLLWLST